MSYKVIEDQNWKKITVYQKGDKPAFISASKGNGYQIDVEKETNISKEDFNRICEFIEQLLLGQI
jgi:hypothetical protein